jgi:hypothetical protein
VVESNGERVLVAMLDCEAGSFAPILDGYLEPVVEVPACPLLSARIIRVRSPD